MSSQNNRVSKALQFVTASFVAIAFGSPTGGPPIGEPSCQTCHRNEG